jgi:glutamyl/glutaminyl-tRNA synthetase
MQRCKPHFLPEMMEDLQWFGLHHEEGYHPTDTATNIYIQSKRFHLYQEAWKILYDKGYIYPCTLSRRDVQQALSAPQEDGNTIPIIKSQQELSLLANTKENTISNDTGTSTSTQTQPSSPERIFPIELRPSFLDNIPFAPGHHEHFPGNYQHLMSPFDVKVNWRFRVPDAGTIIQFHDNHCGYQSYTCNEEIGDFLVWRLDGYPSYELAVVVDDILMGITEVVRGQDLLVSTARQLLLMKAIFDLDYDNPEHWHSLPSSSGTITIPPVRTTEVGTIISAGDVISTVTSSCNIPPPPPFPLVEATPTSILPRYRIPQYYHTPLLCDETGRRLAKRSLSKSLRILREEQYTPEQIKQQYFTISQL